MSSFEQLRIDDPTEPTAAPDARFAARLRRQLEAALLPTIDLPEREDLPTMTEETTTAHDRTTATQVLVPYIAVHDAAAALEWYTESLGATETVRYVGDDGRIGHAEFTVHGGHVMMSDAYPEIGVIAANSYDGSSCALHLEVEDCDSVHASAIEGGAVSLREPEDQPHGSRMSTVLDPFGIRWMFSQTFATPTTAEIHAAMSDFTVIEPDHPAPPPTTAT